MSTFHSDTEQSLGFFVCFCKIPLYFYREGKWSFSKLYFIWLSYKKGQRVGTIPYSACLYMRGALAAPEDGVGPCWWLQEGSSGRSHQTYCPLALAKLCSVTKESCQTDVRC